jgi:hypothetical protein
VNATSTSTQKTGTHTTRSAERSGASQLDKTREELYSKSDINWSTTTAADLKRHLYAKGFIYDEAASMNGLSGLALVLLQIAADTGSVMTADACRVVAALLEMHVGNETINEVAANVKTLLGMVERLAPNLHELENGGEKVLVTDVNSAAEMLTHMVEQQCQDMWRLTERLEAEVTQVVRRVEDVVGGVGEARGHASEEVVVAGPPCDGVAEARSYAGVTASGLQVEVQCQAAAVVASARAKENQILITRSLLVDTNDLTNLSERLLVVKANLVLEEVKKTDNMVPEGCVFVGAQKTQWSHSVLHELCLGCGMAACAAEDEGVPSGHGRYINF